MRTQTQTKVATQSEISLTFSGMQIGRQCFESTRSAEGLGMLLGSQRPVPHRLCQEVPKPLWCKSKPTTGSRTSKASRCLAIWPWRGNFNDENIDLGGSYNGVDQQHFDLGGSYAYQQQCQSCYDVAELVPKQVVFQSTASSFVKVLLWGQYCIVYFNFANDNNYNDHRSCCLVCHYHYPGCIVIIVIII